MKATVRRLFSQCLFKRCTFLIWFRNVSFVIGCESPAFLTSVISGKVSLGVVRRDMLLLAGWSRNKHKNEVVLGLVFMTVTTKEGRILTIRNKVQES